MSEYRSRSYGHGSMQIERYYGQPSTLVDDAPPPPPPLPPPPGIKDWNMKKAKSTSTSFGFNDPEFQRRKRVASYKVYSVEGKVKGSFRKSFRWLKDKYTRVVYGWW
ncbi:hypothetical protein LIER_18919 [Lithospermum erythrorhizon]|uniref:DUF3511 domain protein n=1 Tax=Lithospermum erythrorhizon TaxID=34254 RepID=A0AAV3QFY1_LITER